MYIAYYAVMAVIWVVIIVLCVRRLKRVNVNYPNTGRGYFDGKILQLHRYLEERATCEAVVDALNETDLAYLEGLPAERREIAREIFAGFDGHGKL